MNAVITSPSMGSAQINPKEYKAHALIAYILLSVGLFTGVPLLIGAIWAMIKKSGSIGTIYHSHLVNVTRIFWWSLFWCIIGSILTFIAIGYAIFAITWIWALYRVIDGLAKILVDEAYPV